MILLGFIASIFIEIFKSTSSPLSENQTFFKYFIIGLLYPAIGYCLNILFSSSLLKGFSLLFLNSIFLIAFICMCLYTYAEFKKKMERKAAIRYFFLGFILHNFLGYLVWPEKLNVFWPIKDEGLAYSFLSSIFKEGGASIDSVLLIYISAEFGSLYFYGKFLIAKMLKKSGSAKDISRVGRLLKLQRYLFATLLCIFFVIYIMQILSLDIFFVFLLASHLFIVFHYIYISYKTNFIKI